MGSDNSKNQQTGLINSVIEKHLGTETVQALIKAHLETIIEETISIGNTLTAIAVLLLFIFILMVICILRKAYQRSIQKAQLKAMSPA